MSKLYYFVSLIVIMIGVAEHVPPFFVGAFLAIAIGISEIKGKETDDKQKVS